MGEEAPAFVPGRPLFHQLEEHASRRASAAAVFSAHAAMGFTLERVREDGRSAVLA
jgi:hypothetical protein